MTKAIPEGYHTLSPVLVFKDARKAIDFYKNAFGAQERFVMPGPGGRGVMHADLQIGDSRFMLGEENPHQPHKAPDPAGNCPVSFFLYVQDAEAAFKKAVNAGAQATMAVDTMFWGDRLGTVKDPFGYHWSVATHVTDMSEDDIRKAGEQAMMAGQKN